MAVGDFIEKYEFDYLMGEALSQIPEGIDTREGSIIYDALAPACMQLAEFYMNLMNLVNDSFPSTAIGEYLDMRVLEQGLTRLPETFGVKLGKFTDVEGNLMDVPLGSRFSSVGYNSLIYRVTKRRSPGIFEMTSELPGSEPNSYIGNILPIDNIADLGISQITENVIEGRSLETDDSLRERYFLSINEKPFGGNIADYRKYVLEVEGVEGCQIYPTWNGGGTVGIQITSPGGMPSSDETIQRVEKLLDDDGKGIAPIGHTVTIQTPSTVEINISADVVTSSGSDVQLDIEKGISDYLLSVRQDWGKMDSDFQYHTYVYIARILVVILQTPGVLNASNVMINGEALDLHWQHSMENSRVPILGGVILNGD